MPETPVFVIITHWLNVLFLLLMARSGMEVLSAFPKMYARDDCTPGREWARFSKKNFGADSRRMWSGENEEESWSSVVALPGKKNLGLGRHWHFATVPFWVLTGAVYVLLMFTSGWWRYMVPTGWDIFPDSIKAVGTYLHFQLPKPIPGEPYEPAQKLAYFVVVFLLAPFQIATGAAMSPAVLSRFPWYGKLFGGKQGARSLHFLGLVAFAGFVVLHTFLVVIHGLPKELTLITLGSELADHTVGLVIGLGLIALIIVVHAVATVFSLRRKRSTQHLLGAIVHPLEHALSRAARSHQHQRRRKISPYFRVNGYPPTDPAYDALAADGFADYRLAVGGLVEQPVSLSLPELTALGVQSQTTDHNCIQGWTGIAEWSGVPLSRVLELVKPLPSARFIVFYAMDDKGLTDEHADRYGHFYGSLEIALAADPQTILAVGMNGVPLPVEHGAPVRLRAETQLGFKMVKWLRGIEFVEDLSDIGQGQGGWREDFQQYSTYAGI
ncbi:cytochrome b561 [Modestobacter sp. DSM 44400]|uniref:molybdopterin-dependent oxidoreductase n=1 Tax=Modestobacter sp. DSM 44400 TaxID=1550230 RepID=UPI00089987BA|nr:molybdopterin-dependent oxidoreductase [Modestobacter sp. DSM 44400]SDX90679.1 cytochrome b561 [Modestobacter sp. DSM 44400]